MKFISKNANLRVVLKHGLQAEPITGRLAIPGLYVKFEDGVAVVNNEETCKLMLAHPGFDRDFISADDVRANAYTSSRRENEPIHQITELKYGTLGKSVGPKPKIRYTPEMTEAIKQEAIKLAKEIAPELAKEMVKTVLKQSVNPQEENSGAVPAQFVADCGFVAKSHLGLGSHKRHCKKCKEQQAK